MPIFKVFPICNVADVVALAIPTPVSVQPFGPSFSGLFFREPDCLFGRVTVLTLAAIDAFGKENYST